MHAGCFQLGTAPSGSESLNLLCKAAAGTVLVCRCSAVPGVYGVVFYVWAAGSQSKHTGAACDRVRMRLTRRHSRSVCSSMFQVWHGYKTVQQLWKARYLVAAHVCFWGQPNTMMLQLQRNGASAWGCCAWKRQVQMLWFGLSLLLL